MTSQTETRTLDPDAIGRNLAVMGIDTFFHDAGEGPPLLLLHGSGPGVSAWSNWRPIYPILSEDFRVIAPDQVGFNRTQPPGPVEYGRKLWTDHALALIDELGIERFSVIGNSMGGAIAFSLAAARPEAIDRIVVMGTMGIGGPIPERPRRGLGLRAEPGGDAPADRTVRLRPVDRHRRAGPDALPGQHRPGRPRRLRGDVPGAAPGRRRRPRALRGGAARDRAPGPARSRLPRRNRAAARRPRCR